MSTKTNLPNYRIYDLTGGGAVEDIYAADLDDAIAQGRDWIEDVDWSTDSGYDDSDVIARRRTIKLECKVSKIVYKSEYIPRITEIAHGTYLVWGPRKVYLCDGSGGGYVTATMEAIKRACEEIGFISDESDIEDAIDAEVDNTDGAEPVYLDWEVNDTPDAGNVTDEIDEDATREADDHDCSGSYTDPEPECPVEEGWDFVGTERAGLDEWGCRSHGGTAMTSYEVCRNTGIYRDTATPGVQRNPGQPLSVETYRKRDAASEAWVVEQHTDDDGYIPDWLAEYLERPVTTRFTQDEAEEWVESHDDDDVLDQGDLEHVFAALCGGRPSDQDRSEGLWSHVCAQTR